MCQAPCHKRGTVLESVHVHGLWFTNPPHPQMPSFSGYALGGHQGVKKGCWPETKKMKFPSMFAAWDHEYC